MEQISYHGNKSGIISLLVLLVLISGVTFSSFCLASTQDLSLAQRKYGICKTSLEISNQKEIAGITEEKDRGM